MKIIQKSFLKNIAAIMTLSILLGNSAVVFGQSAQVKIDGIYVDTKPTAETNRAIFVRPDTFGESALLVGTNKGKAMFAKLKADETPFKPIFKPFNPQAEGLVRDINFYDDNSGYLLKDDGIYFSKGDSSGWRQIVNLIDLPLRQNSTAEIWGMSFVNNLRVCIAGVYLKNTGDRDIDKELLFCTNNISENIPKWDEPNKPRNPKTEQLQFTNIYFDKNKNGWAVGTDGAEGIIWYSRDGGRNWEEQNTSIKEPLLGVFGMGENKVFAVGYNGLVFGKNGGATVATKKSDTKIKEGDTVEIDYKAIEKIPGIKRVPGITGINERTKVIGEVEEVKSNGKLEIKVLEVDPNALTSVVKAYYDSKDIDVSNVRKIMDGNDNSGNENPAMWEQINVSAALRVNQTLRSVKFADDALNGFIVGDKGTILYTQDGGKIWKSLTSAQLTAVDLYSIFVDKNYCWIAGSKGAIVRVKYK